ncbi:MAG TPA: NUDIX hydrolase [Candidatus Dormibacteraeota bacterium]
MSSVDTIQAAGGVVVRSGKGGVEVVVVHRKAYDDWTLPKGKCEPGESWEDCAVREVAEETSLHCDLLGQVGATSYLDAKGRPKEVRYWLMRPVSGTVAAQMEIDAAKWVSIADAAATLTYPHDRELLEPLQMKTRLWLVRHADAGDRAAWHDPDELRPLNEHGWEQARGLVKLLAGAPIERLVSSPYVRCVQTLEPLAEALHLKVERVEEFAEGHGLAGLEPLLLSGGSIAVCTHGDILDELVDELRREGLAGPKAKASKGSTWELQAQAGLIVSADYLPPPA